jgi:inner membrane transporter RhtA
MLISSVCPARRIIVTQRDGFKHRSTAAPIAVLVAAMCSIQLGAVLAKQLFPVVGTLGATALRLGLASVMLTVVWRPWRARMNAREARVVLIYGLAMGSMNLFFYSSLDRIPLGIAVALEFTGPLAVATATSRRTTDFVWIVLAAAGLAALLPLAKQATALDPAGIGFALAAGLCWAIYIVFGKRAGGVHGGPTAALGTIAGALAIVPFGLAHSGASLLSPLLLPVACGMALFSSALPYSLEMFALTRMPTRTFGVLMSCEPALGAISGLLFLRESLSITQWAAIGCIMAASAGMAATSPPAALPALTD